MKVIALSGVESTGKTTLAQLISARLRTRGVLAEYVGEAGARAPFPPERLDTGDPEPWLYLITTRLQAEMAARCRPNVDYLICDRPLTDFFEYYIARFGVKAYDRLEYHGAALLEYARRLTTTYDALYWLPAEGTTYVQDGHRAANNDWRDRVDQQLARAAEKAQAFGCPHVRTASGSYRQRGEFVYHDILHHFFGESRPKRAYMQVRAWLESKRFRIIEVRPQGSNSLHRFHSPTDHDDIDAMVIVDGDVAYAEEVRAAFLESKEHLENVVQASLDLLFTPKGLEAHEV